MLTWSQHHVILLIKCPTLLPHSPGYHLSSLTIYSRYGLPSIQQDFMNRSAFAHLLDDLKIHVYPGIAFSHKFDLAPTIITMFVSQCLEPLIQSTTRLFHVATFHCCRFAASLPCRLYRPQDAALLSTDTLQAGKFNRCIAFHFFALHFLSHRSQTCKQQAVSQEFYRGS